MAAGLDRAKAAGENRAIAMEDILGANLPEFAAQGSNRFMPIAGLDENALYPVEIHGYYVYARTQNAGLAQAYLAEYCSARCQNLAEYGLPYYMLLKDPSGFSREEAQFRGQNGIPFAYTPEAESFRLAAAENPLLRTKASVGVRNALGFDTDMRAYLDGDISLDDISRAHSRGSIWCNMNSAKPGKWAAKERPHRPEGSSTAALWRWRCPAWRACCCFT